MARRSIAAAPIDFVGVDPATVRALEELARQEWEFEAMKAQRRQEQMAAAQRETNAVNGLGTVRRNIDAFAFHDWALKEGSYECWRDDDFNRYIDRIAPETKVRSTGTRVQVGYSGSQESGVRSQKPEATAPRSLRFTKSYGAIDGRKK
jgi:hypothetical protein